MTRVLFARLAVGLPLPEESQEVPLPPKNIREQERNEELDSLRTRQDDAEAGLARELTKFRALYDVAVAMTAERSLDDNLLLVVSKSRDLLRGDAAYIALRDNEAGDVYMHVLSGIRTDAFRRMRLPFGAGLGGKVAVTGTGYIIDDYFQEIEPVVHDIVRAEGLISGVAAPLQITQTNLGVLYVFNRNRTKFAKSDLDTLCLLGNLAALEIKRKRVEEKLRQAHDELERRVSERTEELRMTNENLLLEIDERKKTVNALAESEEKYRKLVDFSPDGIHVTVAGKVVFANAATARILGLPGPDDLLGTEILDFIHPEFRPLVRERLRSTLELRNPVPPVEEKYVRADGTTIDVEVTAIPLTYKGQNAAQVIVRDITERKCAEHALRESEEKYRRVVDNANEAILVVQDGVLKFMNPKAKEMVGYVDDGHAVPFLSFVHPEDRDMVLERYVKRLRGEPAPSSYSFRILDKDRNVRWVDLSAVLINWEGSFATLNFISDITERRKIEEDLLKVEKLQSVGLLAGGIAHDFNNILAGVLGNISLAKVYSPPGDKAYERLKQAEKACLRAQGLTQQLLTFSKGGVPLKEVTDMAQLVRECCLFALRGGSVRCDFDFAEHLWPAEVDQGQISQVVGNLVINASHAMIEGGLIEVRGRNVVVSAHDRIQLEPGKYVRISFRDYGVGISQEHLPKIFDPYFTTKRTGSGLGLATSYAVIKRHGGLIAVDSKVGEGATFHIYLAASEKEIEVEQDSNQLPEPGRGRILLMDDEELIRDLGRELLSLLGYEAVLARDGEEALELYKEAYKAQLPFDAIIVDLTVPGGMGGSEVVKILREFDPDLRAIVSSGYSNDPIMADHKRYGFDEMVAKPYTVHELSEALKKIIPHEDDRRA